MSSHAPLRLFPSPTSGPLKRSTSKSNRNPASPEDLHGVALHVTTSPLSYVQDDPIQHNLFCDPPARPPSRSKYHNGKRLSTCSSRYSQPCTMSPQSEDQLGPLPINTSFATFTPNKTQKVTLKRPNVPADIKAPTVADVPLNDDDQLSPLPSKTQFTSHSTRPEYQPALRSRSVSPQLVRSNSTTTARSTTIHDTSAPMRSIFPQYDPTRPVDAQRYYPAVRQSSESSVPTSAVSESSSVQKQTLSRADSAVTLVDGYEHIPVAGRTDMGVIWKASIDGLRKGTRKVQLGVHQPVGKGTSISIGCSPKETLYSMETTSTSSSKTKILVVHKHAAHEVIPSQVAHVPLPSPDSATSGQTAIFPQMAAIHAIEAVSSDPTANKVSPFEARGSSYAAARLAQDALDAAHAHYECKLSRATRQRDLMGGVTATYTLSHPSQGDFALTISRSPGKSHSRNQETRAKISLHHPSATPAAIAAENLVLAFLDFGRDACVLDVPGLLAFESAYMVDVAVCALLSVAAVESEEMKRDVVCFEGPPTKAVGAGLRKNERTKSKKGRKAEVEKEEKKKQLDFQAGEQVEIPGVFAMLGMSIKAGVFLVKIGFKATKGVVKGVHHLAKKL